MQHRSRIDIIASILQASESRARKTHVMYKCNLSFAQLQVYLNFLVERNLLKMAPAKTREDNGIETYETTAKGKAFVRAYHGIRAVLYGWNCRYELSIEPLRKDESIIVKWRLFSPTFSWSASSIFLKNTCSAGDSLIFIFLLSNSKKSYSAKKLVMSWIFNSCSRILSVISLSSCHCPFLSNSRISSMASKACFSAVGYCSDWRRDKWFVSVRFIEIL